MQHDVLIVGAGFAGAVCAERLAASGKRCLVIDRRTHIGGNAFDRFGQVDEELSVKLESELQFESEMKENEQQPASVKDFLANSPFELKDVPGKEDVYLVRKFGNET